MTTSNQIIGATGAKILNALHELGGNVSASDISRRCNVGVSNVVNWIQGNATCYHIHVSNSTPRRYSLQAPSSHTALQQALGYQLPKQPHVSRQVKERHTTASTRNSLPRSSSSAAAEQAHDYSEQDLEMVQQAESVARDVLMAAMRDVVAECVEICDVYSMYDGKRCASEIRNSIMDDKISAVADRYVAQPPALEDDRSHAASLLLNAAETICAQTGCDLKELAEWAANGGMLDRVMALHTKPPAVAAPDDYVLVPVVLTPEMVDAGAESDSQFYGHAKFVYCVMLSAAPHVTPLSAALTDIAAERRRQIEVEGWTPEQDSYRINGDMARAASCYALASSFHHDHEIGRGRVPDQWPWEYSWWKPSTPRRNLVKAGALIVAEIERIDGAAQKGDQCSP